MNPVVNAQRAPDFKDPEKESAEKHHFLRSKSFQHPRTEVTWRENWEFELQLKLEVEEETETAVAEEAATVAAKSPTFFIVTEWERKENVSDGSEREGE